MTSLIRTSAAAYTDDTGLPPSHSTVSMSCTSRSRKIPPLAARNSGADGRWSNDVDRMMTGSPTEPSSTPALTAA